MSRETTELGSAAYLYGPDDESEIRGKEQIPQESCEVNTQLVACLRPTGNEEKCFTLS